MNVNSMNTRSFNRPFIRSRSADERGAYMVLWAIVIVAVLIMSAIAIDLSSLRTDRRSDRLAADAAATAGAASLTTHASDRLAACKKAWDYAARNLGSPSLATSDATVCGSLVTIIAGLITAGDCSDKTYAPGPPPIDSTV